MDWGGDVRALGIEASNKFFYQPEHQPLNHALGRNHSGHRTKLYLATDGAGLFLAVRIGAGRANEALEA